MGKKHFCLFIPPRPGNEPRALAWKAAVLTTTPGPPPITICAEWWVGPTLTQHWANTLRLLGVTEWIQSSVITESNKSVVTACNRSHCISRHTLPVSLLGCCRVAELLAENCNLPQQTGSVESMLACRWASVTDGRPTLTLHTLHLNKYLEYKYVNSTH